MLNFEEIIEEELFENSIEEMSTSAGAGAFLTKNAFSKKLPKYKLSDGYTQVKESYIVAPKGAGQLPKSKSTHKPPGHLKTNDKGVINTYYEKLGYKKVDRKKLAKQSKAYDSVQLNGSSE
jgi:DNA polymerase sigma